MPRPRCKRRKEDEPPFELEQVEPRACTTPGCSIKVLDPNPKVKLCVLHAFALEQQRQLKKKSAQAMERGDNVLGTLQHLAAGLIDVVAPAVTKAVANAARDPREFARNAQAAWARTHAANAVPPTSQPDCWDVLGLDSKTAKPDDVRRMQRELARLYHPDRAPSPAASRKLAQVNAAASEALRHLHPPPRS